MYSLNVVFQMSAFTFVCAPSYLCVIVSHASVVHRLTFWEPLFNCVYLIYVSSSSTTYSQTGNGSSSLTEGDISPEDILKPFC